MFKFVINFLKNIFKLKKPRTIDNIKSLKLNKNLIIKGGLYKDKQDNRDLIKVCSTNDSKTIDSFSLKEFAPLPKDFDQKSTSACGGFSASAFMHILMNKMQKLSNASTKAPMFSPLWIYWNARLNDGFGAEKKDEGTTLRSVMKALRNPGVIEESYWKFGWHFPTEEPNTKAKESNKITLYDYLRIPMNKNAPETVKEILAIEQLPIITGIILYTEQQAEAYKTGYLKEVKDLNLANCIGGHAICITGYKTDPKGKVWLEFINSWNETWGDTGYGYFPIEWLYNPDYIIDIWTCSKNYF
jgi:hypothetical protein